MNNKIPKELAERQEQQRQNTVNVVRRAIEDLSAEGHKITIKLLMEYTGLSRSVFGKKHVRKVLVDTGVMENNLNVSYNKTPLTEMEQLKKKLQNKDMKIAELMRKNKELRSECELLRGKVFEYMQQ